MVFRSAPGDGYGGLFPIVEGFSQAIGDVKEYHMGRDNTAHWTGRF
jgi:hypothetical protein